MKTPLEPTLSTLLVRPTAAVGLRDHLKEMQEQIQLQGDLAGMLSSNDWRLALLERKWPKVKAIDFARGAGYAEAVSDMLAVSVQLLTVVVLSADQGPLDFEALSDLAEFLSSFEAVE